MSINRRQWHRSGQLLRRSLVAGFAALLLAGCAAADKTATTGSGPRDKSAMVSMNMGSGHDGWHDGRTDDQGDQTGVRPRFCSSSKWQGMNISAEAMTAVPFVIFNGTQEQEVKPTPKTSFHLMVMLTDAETHVAIPYSSVWASISKGSKLVYNERLWPMISRYMGPHYGNNVSLPGSGKYKLSLLVSPPEAARHVEYKNVWLKPHRANSMFHWRSPS